MPKVSIIIPVYNVAPYLTKCLDSICSQTLTDIGIIAVYDPSDDNSLEILREYEKNDKRIKIIVKDKKEGLSIARNRGMEIAAGEYLGFVDSDDYVNFEMFEKLYNKAKKFDAEISFCTIATVNADTDKPLEDKHYNECLIEKKFDETAFNWRDIKEHICYIPVGAWNKIYKKSFMEKNNIVFCENLTFEDNPFFF